MTIRVSAWFSFLCMWLCARYNFFTSNSYNVVSILFCYNCLLISISILNMLVEKVYLALVWYWCHIVLMIADMWTCGPICCYKLPAAIKYINRVSVAVADSGQYPIRYYNPIISKPGTILYRQSHRSTSSDGHSPNLTLTGNVYSQQKLVWLADDSEK